MDALSFDDLFRIGRDEILARNKRITRDVVERDGTDVNALCAAAAAVGDELMGQLVRLCAKKNLDSARGTDLHQLVFDLYGLVPKVASAARGSVRFSTTAPAPGSFTIPSGLKLGTTDGKQFVTTESAVFPAGSTGPVTVAVRSIAAGLAQQAGPGTITSIVDSVTGSPSDLVVTNTLATAGADDEEQDDDFRARGRAYYPSLRRGTLAAIQLAALGVAGVRKAAAFEVLDGLGRPSKAVQLIVSDAFTDALVGQTSTAYATQSQVFAGEVFAALDDWRAAGIFVDVRVAQVVLQGFILALSFEGGADVETTALAARAAVTNAVNALAPGAPVLRAALEGALRSVPGLIVTGGEVLSPAGDVIPSSYQAMRTTLGLVRASTVQPDRALQGSSNPDGIS